MDSSTTFPGKHQRYGVLISIGIRHYIIILDALSPLQKQNVSRSLNYPLLLLDSDGLGKFVGKAPRARLEVASYA